MLFGESFQFVELTSADFIRPIRHRQQSAANADQIKLTSIEAVNQTINR